MVTCEKAITGKCAYRSCVELYCASPGPYSIAKGCYVKAVRALILVNQGPLVLAVHTTVKGDFIPWRVSNLKFAAIVSHMIADASIIKSRF
jgi:hypothetical protein